MNRQRSSATFSVVALLLLIASASACASDISGTWVFTVERTDGPVNNEMFIFKQSGGKLTGTYSGYWFREKNVMGTVKDDEVIFNWDLSADSQGGKRPPTVTFVGKLESSSKMSGTVEVPYCPEGQKCNWTATKKK